MIPVLNSLIEDSSAVSLLMYPTKALCNDQTLALQSWVLPLKVAASLKCCGNTIYGCRPSLWCCRCLCGPTLGIRRTTCVSRLWIVVN